jgi:hypothetical protein
LDCGGICPPSLGPEERCLADFFGAFELVFDMNNSPVLTPRESPVDVDLLDVLE